MINITRGEKKIFTIKIKNQDGDAFDLTDFDEFEVCLPKASGKLSLTEVANVNGSIVELVAPAINGKLQVTIFPTDTSLLNVDERQDIGVKLNNSVTPNPKSKLGEGILNVRPDPCA